jgi:hypothetical protein
LRSARAFVTPVPTYLTTARDHGLTFSICTLVRDQVKYDRLLASFERFGFDSRNSEFLAADNRLENRFDGYSWHKALLPEARGKFVVFCHDDVELLEDGAEALVACLDDLDRRDPTWMLAGVAGGIWRPDNHEKPRLALHISDPFGSNRRRGKLPCRAETLDECFIIMRRTRPVMSSSDLTGFHFYGPDLCLQAELLGGSSHIIDFHLRHHGHGTRGPEFRACRSSFVRKYQPYFPGRTLHCTTGMVKLTQNET